MPLSGEVATTNLDGWKLEMRHRTKPYTEKGILRVACFRCGCPSKYQWNCCADGNIWRGLCQNCDIELNETVLNFFNHPQKVELLRQYKAKVEGGR